MKTIDLSGFIRIEYDGFTHYLLEDAQGFKADVVSRMAEIAINAKGPVQVNWWVSDTAKTKDQCVEALLRKAFGDIIAEYETEHYQYSSYTSGTNEITHMKIGGHDLSVDLSANEGKYINIEVNFGA